MFKEIARPDYFDISQVTSDRQHEGFVKYDGMACTAYSFKGIIFSNL